MSIPDTIVSISAISVVPVIYGIVFTYFYSDKHDSLGELFAISYKGHPYSIYRLRMIYLFILSFLSVLIMVRILDPVPSEGRYRTLFIMILISLASLFNYSLLKVSCRQHLCRIIQIILILILVSMVFGLELHKPWSYLMFISPFYWTGWAWIIPSPVESIAYSAIAIILSGFYMLFAVLVIKKAGVK